MSGSRAGLQTPAEVFSRKYITAPTDSQTALRERFLRLIATTDFVFLEKKKKKSLTRADTFGQIYTHGIHFKTLLALFRVVKR